MAIKFTFTLNDIEASNLFDWIRAHKCNLGMQIVEEMSKDKNEVSDAKVKWYKAHQNYMDKVTDRMLSNQERIPDSEEFEIHLDSTH